ncbi:MAG: TetR/AcrR family transcriptional regulator [Neorhizobium sp.]|jgi:AcrR family transcriptional regulator|nr:TetR/AcrR family transcriptional regulator [Neorhizobium sp.]
MSVTSCTAANEIGKRGRGRPKTQGDSQRREEIIRTARNTFIELGYTGTTTDIVAQRCHISKQTLYRLFASKAELFAAIVADHRQLMLELPRPADETVSGTDDVADVLEKIFMINITDERKRERDAFIQFVIKDSEQIPELVEVLHREGADKSMAELADWLAEQATAGRVSIADPMSGARMLMDMLFGAMAGPLSRNWPNREKRTTHMRSCIAIFVRGSAP